MGGKFGSKIFWIQRFVQLYYPWTFDISSAWEWFTIKFSLIFTTSIKNITRKIPENGIRDILKGIPLLFTRLTLYSTKEKEKLINNDNDDNDDDGEEEDDDDNNNKQ